MRNVHRMMMDAALTPAFGADQSSFLRGVHEGMAAISREVTEISNILCDALHNWDRLVSHLPRELYEGRPMPEYYHELCPDFFDLTHTEVSSGDSVPLPIVLFHF